MSDKVELYRRGAEPLKKSNRFWPLYAAGLENLGRNLYKASAASGEPTTDVPGTNGLGTLGHGFIEMSNVKVVEEMVNMIVAQRAYEINAKAIQTADDMLQIANNLRR